MLKKSVLYDSDQGLIEFHGLAIFNKNSLNHTCMVGFDLVHHLHSFNYAHYIAGLNVFAHFDEHWRRWRRGAIERSHHRRLNRMSALRDGRWGGWSG